MARVNGEVITLGNDIDNGLEIAEVEAGRYALGVQVEGQVDEIHVAGSLSISEETALDPVSTSKHTKFCRRDSGSYNTMAIRRRIVLVACLTNLGHYVDVNSHRPFRVQKYWCRNIQS